VLLRLKRIVPLTFAFLLLGNSFSVAQTSPPPAVCSPANLDALQARLSQVSTILDRMEAEAKADPGWSASVGKPASEAAIQDRYQKEQHHLETCLRRLSQERRASQAGSPGPIRQDQADVNLGTFEAAQPEHRVSGSSNSTDALRVSDCLAIYSIGPRIGHSTLPLANSCLALLTVAYHNPPGATDFKREACQSISAQVRSLGAVVSGPDFEVLQRMDVRARQWCTL